MARAEAMTDRELIPMSLGPEEAAFITERDSFTSQQRARPAGPTFNIAGARENSCAFLWG